MTFRINIPQNTKIDDSSIAYKIFKLRKLPQTLHDINRAREIFSVIVRHDIGYFFDFLNNTQLLKNITQWTRGLFGREKAKPEYLRFPLEKRIRLAFEELGPTFVKLGQVLSTRGDILPQRYVSEFQKLQDKVPPFSSKDAIHIIEDELNQPINNLYTYFDENPIAAASIGQVHRAGIKLNGEDLDVVIKIRRPGIEKIIQTDIDILFAIAQYLEKHIPDLQLFSPKKVVKEFARTIQKEMNYIHEAYNMLKFADNFKDVRNIKVPDVYFDFSTERILTMEFIDGMKITDFELLEKEGINKNVLARNGTEFILKQIFVNGFFHADPHPGNVFILPGNILSPIDFGMMGVVDDERITELMHLLVSIFSYDMDSMVKLFYRMELIKFDIDIAGLKGDIKSIVEKYRYIPMKKLNLGVFFTELLETIKEYRICLPTDLFLMIKAITSMADTASRLDRTFDSFNAIQSFLDEKYPQRITDPRLKKRMFKQYIDDFSQFLIKFPRNIDESLQKLKEGKLKGNIVIEGADKYVDLIEMRMRQNSLFTYVASLNIAGAICLYSSFGTLVFGVPVSALLGTIFLVVANTIALLSFF